MQTTLKITKDINPRVLVYHRFCNSNDPDEHKIDSNTFEWQINTISRYFDVLSLSEIIELKKNNQKIPARTVALTIDDGYKDFHEHAYPLLKKKKMKATFFVTVNFINQKTWLWPDRLKYAINNTQIDIIDFYFNGRIFSLSFTDSVQKFKIWNELSNYCISVNDNIKWELIHSLEKELCVDVPNHIPYEYEPVTWSDLKEMSENGIEIGSHTLNHPILSKIKYSNLFEEIHTSKTEIESRLHKKVVSFCYPNSAPGDIDDVVINHVKSAGYGGAVFGTLPGSKDIFQIPRIGIERNKTNFLWKLSGMEFYKY